MQCKQPLLNRKRNAIRSVRSLAFVVCACSKIHEWARSATLATSGRSSRPKLSLRLPLFPVAVDPLKSHVVASAGLGFILPDGGFDSPQTNFVDRAGLVSTRLVAVAIGWLLSKSGNKR